jgi:hypothetical protein
MPMEKSGTIIYNKKEAGKFWYKNLSKGKKDKVLSHI